ncbi:hypothetical protein B566_EDAN000632 [Ephemera danica]|nr:hypothetical protein B566_EDAN000632 [Ephemera danica]
MSSLVEKFWSRSLLDYRLVLTLEAVLEPPSTSPPLIYPITCSPVHRYNPQRRLHEVLQSPRDLPHPPGPHCHREQERDHPRHTNIIRSTNPPPKHPSDHLQVRYQDRGHQITQIMVSLPHNMATILTLAALQEQKERLNPQSSTDSSSTPINSSQHTTNNATGFGPFHLRYCLV